MIDLVIETWSRCDTSFSTGHKSSLQYPAPRSNRLRRYYLSIYLRLHSLQEGSCVYDRHVWSHPSRRQYCQVRICAFGTTITEGFDVTPQLRCHWALYGWKKSIYRTLKVSKNQHHTSIATSATATARPTATENSTFYQFAHPSSAIFTLQARTLRIILHHPPYQLISQYAFLNHLILRRSGYWCLCSS